MSRSDLIRLRLGWVGSLEGLPCCTGPSWRLKINFLVRLPHVVMSRTC